MKRQCLGCGAVFEGRPDSTLCPACAKKSKDSIHWRMRTCRECGSSFLGGPRAWYCPSCRAERKRAQAKAYKKHGPARPLGSTDICPICGREYIVTGGLQKYCPDCAPAAIAAVDREQSRRWNREHIDLTAQREARQAATAEIPCVICGKTFRPNGGSPVTCSPACAAEYRRRQGAIYQREHREELSRKDAERHRDKINAMTPEELAAYRETVNAKARENYRKRKEQEKHHD